MNKNPEKQWLLDAVKKVPGGFSGHVGWQSPSNIALVKYWGKHGNQLPNNPSVSFTLKTSRTETVIDFREHSAGGLKIEFFFEGAENAPFGSKIKSFLESIQPYFPFLDQLALNIQSKNTFPHSSGIASSASSMSALVMALLEVESTLTGLPVDLQKASYFSRLGSGSASRSVFPKAALWGQTKSLSQSDNRFAVPMASRLHPVFAGFYDSIIIISAEKKEVSSRAGHALMHNNPFADVRYQQAVQNTDRLIVALQDGDLETFMQITEAEALQLHALMMTSEPSFVLMQPNSLAVIAAVRHFRTAHRVPVCFTLDAGPNIHLLYPQEVRDQVLQFINESLLRYAHEGLWIDDRVGEGPTKIA